ncbi:MAG: ACT domain-containing protein [Firmicutes bacterium]|nr:ACT domain-containing protein [Bacillota bacterium]HAL63381.1 ACT domain-containing protein [Clostridiales bacterium]
MRAVITVVGKDKVGIIAKVSALLSENGINILDISQTIMQDVFTMIMLVDMQGKKVSDIADGIEKIEKDMGLSIHIQNEDIFNLMHRV